jgi:hypothetical protein
VVNIVNSIGGGFRHYSGLLPANPGAGDSNARASVKPFHIPSSNAVAIFRGDIVTLANGSSGADLPPNIAAANTGSVLIGNGGGSGLGNPAIAPDVARLAPAQAAAATVLIVGVVVGFAFTLYTAKNGYQYIPAGQESWVLVDTDPMIEMYITQPVANQTQTRIGSFYDILANAGQQQTRFGISGLSLAAAPGTAGIAPLRLLGSGEEIGNDVTATTNVAKVGFNPGRHFRTAPQALTAAAWT